MDIRFSASFLAQLDDIERDWLDRDFSRAFDFLLDELSERVLPLLERHPRLGRRFMARLPASVQARALHDALLVRLARQGPDADLREYVMDDYLILYMVVGKRLELLSIRHHKQLAFDLADFLGMPDRPSP